MRIRLPRVVLVTLCTILNGYLAIGQIVDLDSENPYKKVFVQTDNFGASYLSILEESYPEVKPDSIRFSMLNDLAYYWHTRNLHKAMEFTELGLEQTALAGNSLWEGRFQITQGAILLRMEQLDRAQRVLEEAMTRVRPEDLAFLNTQMGYVYERRGLLDKAADYAMESLQIGKELGDNKAMALAYSDLSNLFWKQGKFDMGLEYGLNSLKLFEERRIIDLDYDFTLYVVGNNYLELKDYEQALKYYNHAIAIGERYGFYNNLSDVYISMVDLHAFLNQFEAAEEAGESALKYAALLENNFMLMRSWLSIGKLQNLQGKYTGAIESLVRCIEIATDNFGDAFYLSQAYETLGKAYAGNHQYQEAYASFEKYDQLKNVVFTAEADHRISLLQTEFEVAKKDGTIQLQGNKIKKQRSVQLLTALLTGLLLLYLVLLVKAYRSNIRKNKLLEKQNEEKEFLLKEIHHRVKNNLEIVSSLLSLQSAQIDDPNITEAIKKSQQRVHSMSMIHQKLYQGKSIAAIEMKDYFVNLGQFLIDSYGATDRIELKCAMPPLELDVDMAVPIGLIVNELLTNAMKYAFPEGCSGQITVDLRKVDSCLQLTVKDNGIGKVSEGKASGTGFGTQLIDLLTRQLDGKMKLNVNEGTSVSFKFQLNKAA
ncbi:MAG TPA: histidine kinase dimerization/phosphoacceptor domain -containing protein [Eudoraea sp.]|nr:histidine kinase dimerization/phosphoacceptor domain -containing protein [Eudoraea sp.]